MFINNVNISKGTINDAILIITSIIYDLQNNVITIKVQLIYLEKIFRKHFHNFNM
jgi:hypothetical protein